MQNKKEAEWEFDEKDGDVHYLTVTKSRVKELPDGRVRVTLTTYETRQAIYAHNPAKARFKKELLKKQNYRCSFCGGELPKRPIMHHDPPLSKGGRYINRRKQMNFLVCKECHNKVRRKDFTGHPQRDF